MISLTEKKETLQLLRETMAAGVRKKDVCECSGISIRTYQRWEKSCIEDARKGSVKKVPRKLTDEERHRVIEIACSPAYKDLNPYEIVAILAEKGVYIGSESTIYRILLDEGLLHHRSNQKPRTKKSVPDELVADGPNQVWSWDITWMKTDVRGLFFYAYAIIDIWSKDIIGWEIHDREDDELAAAMFKRLKVKCNMRGVFLRSDNGNPMKGATMLMTLYHLGVIPSYSRPKVSNDNPFIESLFKTVKYTAGYPGHFTSIDHARNWMATFVNWYRTEHRHSGIGYVTPEQRRSGDYKEIFKKRNATLETARLKNPERWSTRLRVWGCDEKVYLNPAKGIEQKKILKTA